MAVVKRARTRLLVLLCLLGLSIGLLVMTVRDRLGFDREIDAFGAAACERVKAPAGPEDLEIDDQLKVAFIAAADRRRPGARGDLYLLDLHDLDAAPVAIPRDGPELAPLGLSLRRIDEQLYLHVVNHADPEAATIEQYRYLPPSPAEDGAFVPAPGRLLHLATVSGAALISPNDVAAVDATRFYVSNDHGAPPGLLRSVEHLLGLRLGDVQYYDGAEFQTVAERQGFANGLLLTQDGRRLLVAETVAGTVTSYLRDETSGSLAAESYMAFETGPDNLTEAEDGSIWMVGHERLVDFAAHARDAGAPSPTSVYRIDFYGRTADFGAVLVDDGSLLSGGSVAAVRGRLMWVGNVFDPYLLRCTLNPSVSSGAKPPLPEPQHAYQ